MEVLLLARQSELRWPKCGSQSTSGDSEVFLLPEQDHSDQTIFPSRATAAAAHDQPHVIVGVNDAAALTVTGGSDVGESGDHTITVNAEEAKKPITGFLRALICFVVFPFLLNLLLYQLSPRIVALANRYWKLAAVLYAIILASWNIYSYNGAVLFGLYATSVSLFHEYGHRWAFRRLNVQADFVPFMFMTMGLSETRCEYVADTAKVALAGPLFQLLSGSLALIGFLLTDFHHLGVIALVAIKNEFTFLNLLLPIFPLDGGAVATAFGSVPYWISAVVFMYRLQMIPFSPDFESFLSYFVSLVMIASSFLYYTNGRSSESARRYCTISWKQRIVIFIAWICMLAGFIMAAKGISLSTLRY